MDLPKDDSEFTNPITGRRFGLDRMPEYFMARMQQISGARFSPEVMHVKTDTGGRLPGEAPKSIFYKGYEIRMGVVDDEKFWVGIYHPERKVEPDSRVGKALFALNSNTVNHSGGNSYAVFFSNGRRSGSSMENFLVAEYRKRLDDPDTITLGIFTGLRGVVKAIYEEDKQPR
ncbi:hypothetical protein AUJ64_04075 [Candidatus Pacearchaeota archaeon CG1_02_39_14]|nr:MAG: hypothetical protein AUJ64_04075 [Candidatus Pacearchaeota archaeon CG1_02_39_14]